MAEGVVGSEGNVLVGRLQDKHFNDDDGGDDGDHNDDHNHNIIIIITPEN